jgi:uncharacterized protein (DUF362 family)
MWQGNIPYDGIYYGCPKKLFQREGIGKSILDINKAGKPDLAIVDGVVGMEGDGPIIGTPKRAGVLAMGRNLPSVNATSARIMGIDPHQPPYLAVASERLGPIRESSILQRGEKNESVQTDFALCEQIPAQIGIRL